LGWVWGGGNNFLTHFPAMSAPIFISSMTFFPLPFAILDQILSSLFCREIDGPRLFKNSPALSLLALLGDWCVFRPPPADPRLLTDRKIRPFFSACLPSPFHRNMVGGDPPGFSPRAYIIPTSSTLPRFQMLRLVFRLPPTSSSYRNCINLEWFSSQCTILLPPPPILRPPRPPETPFFPPPIFRAFLPYFPRR